jgi:hypothetical protein
MVSTHEFAREMDALVYALENSNYMRWLASKEFAEIKEKL